MKFIRTRIRRSSLRGLSIQQRLPLLICFLLLSVILVFSWISYIGVRNAALKTGRERLTAISTQFTSMFAQSGQTLVSASRNAIDRSPVIRYIASRDSQSARLVISELEKFSADSTSIFVELRDMNSRRLLASSRHGIENRVRFDSLLPVLGKDSAVYIGNIYAWRDSMYYPVVIPIADRGRVYGHIVRWRAVITSPRSIEQLSVLLGSKASFFVGNRDGSLWTDMMKPMGPIIPEGTTPRDGIFEYTRGGPMLASVKPIGGTPWLVAIEFSRQTVLSIASQYLQRLLIFGGAVVLVGIFAAWLMSRNITRPLNKLTGAASMMAAGHFAQPVQVERRDEIGKLSRAFNAMSRQVKSATAELEKKVIEAGEVNEQLRNLSGHLQNIREEERIHIAREMHDELGQLLTSFKMDVAWLRKRLADTQDAAIKEKLQAMIIVVDESVKFVRRLAAELRPGILDDLGLVAALEWHSTEFERRYNIIVDFRSSVNHLDIPAPVATGLFRIYQESLTNVARHSGATKVEASLKWDNGTIQLSILDDGRGFDAAEKNTKTLGLLGMKERAAMIGGNLSITSTRGKGTAVLITVPGGPSLPATSPVSTENSARK